MLFSGPIHIVYQLLYSSAMTSSANMESVRACDFFLLAARNWVYFWLAKNGKLCAIIIILFDLIFNIVAPLILQHVNERRRWLHSIIYWLCCLRSKLLGSFFSSFHENQSIRFRLFIGEADCIANTYAVEVGRESFLFVYRTRDCKFITQKAYKLSSRTTLFTRHKILWSVMRLVACHSLNPVHSNCRNDLDIAPNLT